MTALYKLGAPSTSVCVDQSGSNWNRKKGAKLAKRLFERVTPKNCPIVSLFLFSTYHKNFQISLHGINYETSHFWCVHPFVYGLVHRSGSWLVRPFVRPSVCFPVMLLLFGSRSRRRSRPCPLYRTIAETT